MADSAVSFLLQKLSQILVDEAKLIAGVENKIRYLTNEFKFIDIFLKSSEGKRSSKIVEEVVKQIRDVAYEVEDLMDIYVANAATHRSRNMLSKLLCCISHVMMLHEVDSEIERIKATINSIYQNKDRYSIGEGEFKCRDDNEELIRRRRRDVEEEEVVGLLDDSSFVLKQLMETGSCCSVVSITGMGGLGKTTLARKIYNKKEVGEVFPFRAWGYVSNDYRVEELLLSLLKCLLSTSEYNGLFEKRHDYDEEEMKEKVKESLRGKKYLVVLDDIWKTQVWDDLQGVFPNDNNGSRILITSRDRDVASYAGTMPPCELSFLDEEESWQLFCKKVFPAQDCHSNLRGLGKELVGSCKGLPLAIIVMAGLAKKGISQREWLKIKGNVNQHCDDENGTRVVDILKLSYDSLPQRLKPCFLYLGIFPEDYEILGRELIKLWIAEGFIQVKEIGNSDVPEPEDIADHYLDELVDRSLVQVASRRSDGGVKTCRIHDHLRDLCISEGKADKFLEVRRGSNIPHPAGISNSRKLSIHCTTDFSWHTRNTGNQSCTRSLFFFAHGKRVQNLTLKDFKLARIMYLTNVLGWRIVVPIPNDLKTMIHLRYLRIDSWVKSIPDFIYNLYNLEVIELWSKSILIFSSKLWKLKRLRHLRARPFRLALQGMSSENGKTMPNLQTLLLIHIDPQLESMIRNGSFPNLKKLGLVQWGEDNGDRYSVRELQCLQCLKSLGKLRISGTSKLSSEASVFPPNLTKVTLNRVRRFDSSCMRVLGKLPKLQILKIRGPEIVRGSHDIHFAIEEFPCLQVFKMIWMSHVVTWTLDKGAMPSLQYLVIDCSYLKQLPQELWSLATLQKVHVIQPHSELRNSLQHVVLNNGCKLIFS
ncbi:hypothetical protein HN51_068167 [Arachis hypogaea]|uniref:disease resistance protein RPP13-like n=1 Tax=Arachis ipaensis TaxID=130454 RepID=UPI0007AFA334|nr:disease resistance protein RPP13-like [Arachis ipaensis]XP_025650445.1 disease resistance protein RPP13-like [Arachis hypogaea]XP_025697175.1 disease resistance protein RPP13-like [Arachis hypogaea]QHO09802.1 Disease resistance protein [Arachis hypogaea]